MIITCSIRSSNTCLYHLDLTEDCKINPEIYRKTLNHNQLEELQFDGKVYHMSGLCLIEEMINSPTSDALNFIIEGEYVFISMVNAGTCMTSDNDQFHLQDCQAGMVRMNFGRNMLQEINFSAGQYIHRYGLLLSTSYLKKLLENERWAQDDLFFKAVYQNTGLKAEQYHYMDRSVKLILQDLFSKIDKQTYSLPLFELKLKELFLTFHLQKDMVSLEEGRNPSLNQKLSIAKAYLIAHFAEQITIKQLSRIVSLNEFTLKQQFKLVFGITIHSFVITLRMEAAERMLRENCTVNDMALRTGYKNVSHFILTFKKHYHKTPMQAIKENL